MLRCSNHTKVAEQVLRVYWYLMVLHPALIPHYMAEWTKALSNKPSRGVGINMQVEHSNAELNKKAKGHSLPSHTESNSCIIWWQVPLTLST